MSQYEEKIIKLCYESYQQSCSKEFTYCACNGNDLLLATNAIEALEEEGYITNVIDNGFTFSFIIEDSLIRYMKAKES